MERSGLNHRPAGGSDEISGEAIRSFKRAQLRALMKEREEAVSRLVGIDYAVWVLEEFFRTGAS